MPRCLVLLLGCWLVLAGDALAKGVTSISTSPALTSRQTWRIHVRPSSPCQGNVVELEVTCPLGSSIEATFQGYPLEFFTWKQGGPWVALIGVDLQTPARVHRIRVVAKNGKGDVRTLNLGLPLRPGKFRVQKLKVAPRMVRPAQENKERIEKEAVLVKAILSGVSGRKFVGSFLRPVAGALTASFGGRRVFNGVERNPHAGVDLRGSVGTPVQVPAHGTVVLARELYFAGRCVIVDHGLGLFTQYGHLSRILVQEGQELRPGEVLGRIGKTGRVTGPHLHWGATLRQARVNPMDLMHLSAPPAPVSPSLPDGDKDEDEDEDDEL